jgi:hypothetical protein
MEYESHGESAPLIKRRDFRGLAQSLQEPAEVECCCVESTRLARVPIIRTLFKKKDPSEKVPVLARLGPHHNGFWAHIWGVLLATPLAQVEGSGAHA